MSYIKSRRALGDDTGGAVCRTGAAVWTNGNWWVPVRDASGKNYQLMQTPAILALPSCPAGTSGSGGGLFDLGKQLIGGVTDIIKAKVTPAPTSTTVIQGGGGGMSTTTKVALAGAGVLALLFVAKKMKRK